MEVSGRTDGSSFKDSVGKSSAEEERVLCQPCSSDGEFEVAVGYCQNCNEYFCAACLKVHRKQSVSKHHVVLDGNNMPRPQMSQTQLDYLDKEEAKILTEVNKRKQADENMMAKLEADRHSLQNEIQELEEKLNQQSNKANELFVEAKNLKKRMSFIDATLKQMIQSSQIKQYMFEPSPDVQQIISSHGSLGNLRENTDLNVSKEKKVEMVSQSVPLTKLANIQDQSRSQKKLVDMIPQFEFEINVRAKGDTKGCSFVASVIISPSQVLLADSNNNSVKLVDIKQRKLLARYGFNTYPSDVAKVSEDTVAVTLPNELKIQFLSITQNNEFTRKNKINVNYDCRKLFCKGDKIFVASTRKIVILYISGTLVKEIIFPDLANPSGIVIAHDTKSFFVSNDRHPYVGNKPTAVYRLNFEGSVVATYEDKNLPNFGELTVTRDGTLLVCNSSYPGSIHVLSPECKKIKEILQHKEHISWPYCVSYCDETNKLLVCTKIHSFSYEKLNDNLKIFQMC